MNKEQNTLEGFQEGRILTTKQLAEEITVSERTIYNWRSMGLIPCIKVGSVVRFDYERVRAALNKEGNLV